MNWISLIKQVVAVWAAVWFYQRIFSPDVGTVMEQILIALLGLGAGLVIIAVYLADIEAAIKAGQKPLEKQAPDVPPDGKPPAWPWAERTKPGPWADWQGGEHGKKEKG